MADLIDVAVPCADSLRRSASGPVVVGLAVVVGFRASDRRPSDLESWFMVAQRPDPLGIKCGSGFGFPDPCFCVLVASLAWLLILAILQLLVESEWLLCHDTLRR